MTDRIAAIMEQYELAMQSRDAKDIYHSWLDMYILLTEIDRLNAELATYKEANPPRVHREWVVDECDTSDDVPSSSWINFHCSVCNMDYGLDEGQYGWCRDEEIPYHFCPACGADMRKEKPSERI